MCTPPQLASWVSSLGGRYCARLPSHGTDKDSRQRLWYSLFCSCPQLLSVLKRRLSARPFLLPGMQAAGISSTIPGGVRVPTVPPTRGRVLLLGSGYVSAPILEYLSKTTNYELSIGS